MIATTVDYYTKMERGNLRGVSEGVLEALARGLQLDEAERAHLFDLARATEPKLRPRRRPAKQGVRPGVQRLLDAITDAPALVQDGRLNVLAANRLGLALYSEMDLAPGRPANHARFVFLDARAEKLLHRLGPHRKRHGRDPARQAGRDPHDRNLSDVVGELSTRSEEFRVRWAAHNVRAHQTGAKRFHHPVVGDLARTTRCSRSQQTQACTSSPSAPSPAPHRRTRSALGSWAATAHAAAPAHATHER